MKKKLLVSVILTVAILLGLVSVANSAVIAILSVVQEQEEKEQQSGLLGGTTEEQIWFYLLGKGFSKEVVAGIMGNMFQESGLDPTSVTGRAAGLCMWQDYQAKAGRFGNLLSLATSIGKDWTDLQVQLDFLVMELEGGEATCHRLLISKCGSYENFKNISDVEKATRVFEECFERAGKPNYPRRIQAAKGYYEKYKNMSTPTVPGDTAGTVAPGIAGTINRSERMKWLFPNGTPKSAAQMQQYLVTITVPIVSSKGAESTMTLRVHKMLANEYIAIFKEMKAIGFPVRASDTAAYVWRTMATNGSKISYHSYGSVVDLNWNSNPLVYHGTGAYRPGSDPYSVTQQVVNIWKKHGFYWGGDWKSYKDYMHFTYTNN